MSPEARLLCRLLLVFAAAARSVLARGTASDPDAVAKAAAVVEDIARELGC